MKSSTIVSAVVAIEVRDTCFTGWDLGCCVGTGTDAVDEVPVAIVVLAVTGLGQSNNAKRC